MPSPRNSKREHRSPGLQFRPLFVLVTAFAFVCIAEVSSDFIDVHDSLPTTGAWRHYSFFRRAYHALGSSSNAPPSPLFGLPDTPDLLISRPRLGRALRPRSRTSNNSTVVCEPSSERRRRLTDTPTVPERRSARGRKPKWRGDGKERGKDMINCIGDAVLDVVENTAEEEARKIVDLLETDLDGSVSITPAQESYRDLLRARADGRIKDVHRCLQDIVNFLADSCGVEAPDLPAIDATTDNNTIVDVGELELELELEATPPPNNNKKRKRRPGGSGSARNTKKQGRKCAYTYEKKTSRKYNFRQREAVTIADTLEAEQAQVNPQDREAVKAAAVSHLHRRMAIAFAFVNEFGAPEEEQWGFGKYSIRSKINNMLNIPKHNRRSTVKVLRDVLDCMKHGIEYTGRRDTSNLGRKPILSATGIEANMIARKVQDGLGFKQAWISVLQLRDDMNLPPVTLSAVVGCYHRMPKEVSAANTRGQGDVSNDSPWAKARYRWVKQLLLRFRLIEYDGHEDYEEGQLPIFAPQNVPDYYNTDKLNKIEKSQVVWWDENHMKVKLGYVNMARTTSSARFYYTADGKVASKAKDGEVQAGVAADAPDILNVKFPGEMRGSFGCALVQMVECEEDVGEVVGKRAEPYFYTEKTILGIRRYERLVKEEISRIKTIKKTAGWVVDPRTEGDTYREDLITILNGVGGVAKENLNAQNITNLGDLADMSDDDIMRIAAATISNAITERKLTAWREEAKKAEDGAAPALVDYRRSANPYEARYGDTWEEAIKQSPTLRGYVSVKELVEHIVEASAAVMRGTKHEEDWYFYHDALSQMTAKDTMDWMREKDYLKRWILPMHKLNDDYQYHKGKPLGNSPELMPWDNSLNKDVQDAVLRHVLYTQHLPNNHTAKFALSTPQAIESAYARVLDVSLASDGAPSAGRIKQDIDRVFSSLRKIYSHGGGMVPGLANRNGHRRVAENTWGGVRKRMNDTELIAMAKQWVLPEVAATLEQERRDWTERFLENDASFVSEIEEEEDEEETNAETSQRGQL